MRWSGGGRWTAAAWEAAPWGGIRGWPYKRGDDPGGPRRGRWFGDGTLLSGKRGTALLLLALIVIVLAMIVLA